MTSFLDNAPPNITRTEHASPFPLHPPTPKNGPFFQPCNQNVTEKDAGRRSATAETPALTRCNTDGSARNVNSHEEVTPRRWIKAARPALSARRTGQLGPLAHVAGTSTPSVPTTGIVSAGQPGNTDQAQPGEPLPSRLCGLAVPVVTGQDFKLTHSHASPQVKPTICVLHHILSKGCPLDKREPSPRR
jgi:hypothetical protein